MNKKILVTSIIVVVVVLIVVVAVIVGNHGAPAQQAIQNNSGQTQHYTSATDDFSVNFPGTPIVTSKSFNSPSAGSISETDYTYIASANGKGVVYMVIVFHYPATYQFSNNYLAGALQMFSAIINAKYPGTTVSSEPQSQFLGNAAITASVTVPFMGTPTPGNVLITTKDHNTYVVSAYGLSQSDYSAFLNSFMFAQ